MTIILAGNTDRPSLTPAQARQWGLWVPPHMAENIAVEAVNLLSTWYDTGDSMRKAEMSKVRYLTNQVTAKYVAAVDRLYQAAMAELLP